MKTKFLLASFLIILLAGTLVFFVPPPRKPILATQGRRNARRDSLVARLKQTGKLFRAGDFKQSALLARQGSLEALGAGELQIAARFTGNLGSCRFALHRYREALQSCLEARTLAESVRDNATAGSLDLNISSLYAQLGQMDAATNAIDGAMARLTGPDRLKRLPALLTSLAALDADQERIRKRWTSIGEPLWPPPAPAIRMLIPWLVTIWAMCISSTGGFAWQRTLSSNPIASAN